MFLSTGGGLYGIYGSRGKLLGSSIGEGDQFKRADESKALRELPGGERDLKSRE